MRGIRVENGRIVYFGNPAGYIAGSQAVVDHMVYDGEIETNELERIYDKFDDGQEVPGYTGHSLSVSDVIELYDEEASEFYYVDYRDFKPVAFGGPEPVQSQVLQL